MRVQVLAAVVLLPLWSPCLAARLGDDSIVTRSNQTDPEDDDVDLTEVFTSALSAMTETATTKKAAADLKKEVCETPTGKCKKKKKVPTTKVFLHILKAAQSSVIALGVITGGAGGALLPILGGLTALVTILDGQKSIKDQLADLDASITQQVRQGVRDMQEFHLEGELTKVHAKTMHMNDMRTELVGRRCRAEMFSEVMRLDEGAGELQDAVLERAEKVNKSPLVREAMNGVKGKAIEADDVLRIVLLVEGLWASWLALGAARLQLIAAAIEKFSGECHDEASAADLTHHLKTSVLGAAFERFEMSKAQGEWKEKVDKLVPALSNRIFEETRKIQNEEQACPVHQFATWIPRVKLLSDLSVNAAEQVDVELYQKLKRSTARTFDFDTALHHGYTRKRNPGQEKYSMRDCDCAATLFEDSSTEKLCADIAARGEVCDLCA